jgi:branched-chain amino acid transport system substrate-binding protein
MTSGQPQTFGQLLRRHRIAADLTQEALAARAGLSARGISDMERGLRQAPYHDTVSRLAEALGLSPAERAQFAAAARGRRALSHRGAPDDRAVAPSVTPETSSVSMSLRALTPAATPSREIDPYVADQLVTERIVPSSLEPRGRATPGIRWGGMLLLGALLGVTLFSIGGAAPAPWAGGGTVCMATDFPLTGGDWGPWGVTLEHAVALAVQQNRALGHGYTLDVINRDESRWPTVQANQRQGAQDVASLAQNACVMGVIGPAFSTDAEAEMPITANAGLVMISPATTNPGLTMRIYASLWGVDFDHLHPVGKKTSYFRTVPNDSFQGVELAAFASRQPPHGLGARSAFVVDDHTPDGESMAGTFIQEFFALGGAIVGTDGLPFGGAARIAELAARIALARPDVVCYGGLDPVGGGLLEAQLIHAGYTGYFVGGDGIAPVPTFINQLGNGVTSGIYGIVPVLDPATLTSGPAARFMRDYQARYPGETSAGNFDGYTASAYDAAMILITAIKQVIASGQRVTRAAVLTQVQNIDYVGVMGRITFDQNGDTSHGIFTVFTVRNGGWVPEPELLDV